MKDILLKIVGAHGYDEVEDEPLEFVTEGKIGQEDDGVFLEYEESELSGMEGCITRVNISDSKVTINRKDEDGETIGSLVFEKGNRHEGEINTPMGPIKVEILAEEIKNDITYEKEGKIEVDYFISLEGIGESKSAINMSVMQQDNK